MFLENIYISLAGRLFLELYIITFQDKWDDGELKNGLDKEERGHKGASAIKQRCQESCNREQQHTAASDPSFRLPYLQGPWRHSERPLLRSWQSWHLNPQLSPRFLLLQSQHITGSFTLAETAQWEGSTADCALPKLL